MSNNVLTRYLKECLLKVKQTFAHLINLPKRLATRGKIESLGFQRVGLESKQLGVTWF
jgi:hypothetical protein